MPAIPVSSGVQSVSSTPQTVAKSRSRPNAPAGSQPRKKRRLTETDSAVQHTESNGTSKHEHITQINTIEHLLDQLKPDLNTLMYAYGDTQQPNKQSIDVVAHCMLNIVYGCLKNGVAVLSSSADDVKLRNDVIQNNIGLYSALQTPNDIKQNDK